MNFILFFISYVLTLSGFLLGKSTLEEHIEIKKYVKYSQEILKIIFLGILVFLFNDSLNLIIVISLFCLYILTKYFENKDFNKFYNIIFLGISFIILYINFTNQIYFILFLMFSIIFENSMKKFDLKEEIYSFVIYILIYIGYLFFKMSF